MLITYFSRAGENYSVSIVDRGNTDLLAEIVAEETGGELFRIETVREYPSAYDEMLTVATEERTNKERPELKTSIENFGCYDVIFVGYPIWWRDMPMAMYSFLESYDFSDKTVIPFCTSLASPIGESGGHLARMAKGGDWLQGARFTRSTGLSEIRQWIDTLPLD